MKKNIILDGVEYASIKAACAAYGRNYSTVGSRIRNGWKIEDAITTPTTGNARKGARIGIRAVTVNGVKYRSVMQACKAYNVQYQTVYDRMRKGSTLEQALQAANNLCNSKSIQCFNKSFASRTAGCKERKFLTLLNSVKELGTLFHNSKVSTE